MTAIAGLLNFIPGWVWAILFAGAVTTSCTYERKFDKEKLAHASTKTVMAQERETAATAALAQSQRNRELEQELQNAKAANEAEVAALLEALRRADDAARLASRRLLDATNDAVAAARSRCASANTPGYSTPGPDPIGVLADVLGRADQRAGELAEIADRSRAAGLTCERAYDAAVKALSG